MLCSGQWAADCKDHMSNLMVEDQLLFYSSLVLLPFLFSDSGMKKETENKIFK